MQYSKYNSIIPITQETSILYNAVSDRFVLFRNILSDLIYSSSLDNLNMRHSGLYRDLLEAGAIIDDDTDEFCSVVKLSQDVDNIQEEYELIINPTMDCNFKCWYCYESHITGSKMTPEIVNKVKRHISNIVVSSRNLKILRLSFFGGEPLLYYKSVVAPIIDHSMSVAESKNLLLDIGFTTNGLLVNDTMINHLMGNNITASFQITLDGHRERHDKTRMLSNGTGSYEKIIGNIKKLASNDFVVILRINYTKENLDSVKDIIPDFDDLQQNVRNNIRVSFHNVWQDNEVRKDRPQDIEAAIELFKEKKFIAADSRYEMDDIRYSCYADKTNEAVINYNGEVFKCTARDFSSENRCGVLDDSGNINWASDILARKISAKLQMPICKDCKILPLCGGSCSQKAIELAGKNFCIAGMGEKEKDSVVLNRFYRHYINGKEAESTRI